MGPAAKTPAPGPVSPLNAGPARRQTEPLLDQRKIVTTIEDLLNIHEIKNLRILYSTYFDEQRIDKLMTLLTPDAVCEFGPEYGGDWEGPQTIRANFLSYMRQDAEPYRVLHSITNHMVELTGPDTAKGRCYLIDLNLEEGQKNPLYLFGVYDDLYKKIDGQWLIYRTRIDFLWPTRNIMKPR
jgi:SnoaL-like domain